MVILDVTIDFVNPHVQVVLVKISSNKSKVQMTTLQNLLCIFSENDEQRYEVWIIQLCICILLLLVFFEHFAI